MVPVIKFGKQITRVQVSKDTKYTGNTDGTRDNKINLGYIEIFGGV